MRIGRHLWRTTGLLAFALALSSVTAGAAVHKVSDAGQKARVLSEYGKLPLTFEENKGQTDRQVRFVSRGSGYALFLTPAEAVIAVCNGSDPDAGSSAIRMHFANANATPVVEGRDLLSSRSHYIIGNKPSNWISDVRHFGKVAYRNVYRGIDLVYYGNQRQLEYDFVVAPGADPKQIRMRFDGVQSMRIDGAGQLLLETDGGVLTQHKPIVYQELNGRRQSVAGRYVIAGKDVTFEVARYDARKPLVIDPTLGWATYLGGDNLDQANGIAVDSSGAYVTGQTSSTNFPGISSFGRRFLGETDAFVTKLAATGKSIAYTTYLGGSKHEESLDVAVDASGAVYAGGLTDSTDFPATTGVWQSTLGGGQDGWVAKLDASGRPVWATYVGGFNNDVVNSIAVDSAKRVVVGMTTASSNMFAFAGVQAAFNGGASDGYYAKISEDGLGIVFASYYGSAGEDAITAIALDSANNIFITGRTTSLVLPGITAASLQRGLAKIQSPQLPDAFVTRLAENGRSVTYATYHGGSGWDEGLGIAVDTTGAAYVFGETDSPDLPTAGALQPTNRGNRDTFVLKLSPTGNARVYSTFLGGTGVDNAGDIAVDSTGIAYLVGSTTSTDLPLVDAMQGSLAGARDIFLAQVNAAGTALASSSYLGGTVDDFGLAIALDSANNVYFAGATSYAPYITTGSVQTIFGGGIQDAFVGKLANCAVGLTPTSGTHPYTADLGSIAIAASADCAWVAFASDSWITITSATSGSGPGTVTYSIQQNPSAARTGYISIGGVRFAVSQAQAPLSGGCIFPLEPAAAIALASGTTGTFRIPVDLSRGACPWTATPTVPWIQVFPLSGNDTAIASYTVFPNFGTTIRSGAINVNGQPFVITQAAAALSDAQRFVTLLYFNYLGRYPSPSEIDFQVAALAAGTTRGAMANDFFATPEFGAGGRFVAGLYVGLLNRDPEFGGWLFQRNALATGKVTQTQLVENFLNSAEFKAKYPNLTNEAFVALLYAQILGRAPSSGEVTYHVNTINAVGRVTVTANFLNVPEFRTRISGRLSAFLLYATLLNRGPSLQEQQIRQFQIDSGTPILQLIQEFIQTPEFLIQLL